MIEIQGKYNSAVVFTDSLENSARGQLAALCNQEFTAGLRVRVMPDAHAGAGCVVGATMTIRDKIVPNLVGVDIGCGMETVNIGQCKMDFGKLDRVIGESVPCGSSVRKTPHHFVERIDLSQLTCARHVSHRKAIHSIGTLGGGNHFIEIAQDAQTEDYYLIVHSGSRHVGLQVASWHQKIAGKSCGDDVPHALKYLEGDEFDAYVRDMRIMQEYAALNRKAMVDEIVKDMKWKIKDSFTTIHNYLDTESMIVRKGAVSARKGERLLIPFNMRDGSMVCEGLGNAEWNFSAPHGAGRICSRTEARGKFTLTQFREAMDGIYSSSVGRDTIDECPMAYKPMENILEHVRDTVKVLTFLKPVYNFKAGGQ